jgi:hypothetical protein
MAPADRVKPLRIAYLLRCHLESEISEICNLKFRAAARISDDHTILLLKLPDGVIHNRIDAGAQSHRQAICAQPLVAIIERRDLPMTTSRPPTDILDKEVRPILRGRRCGKTIHPR